MRFSRAIKTTLLASLLVVARCDQSETSSSASSTISVEHAQGVTTVPLHPKKVVVFDPAILDTLDALQIPVAGVP